LACRIKYEYGNFSVAVLLHPSFPRKRNPGGKAAAVALGPPPRPS
jgi:hypothetical protein